MGFREPGTYRSQVRLTNEKGVSEFVIIKIFTQDSKTLTTQNQEDTDEELNVHFDMKLMASSVHWEIPNHIYVIIWGFLLGCTAVVLLLHMRECFIHCVRRW